MSATRNLDCQRSANLLQPNRGDTVRGIANTDRGTTRQDTARHGTATARETDMAGHADRTKVNSKANGRTHATSPNEGAQSR